jgi:hypothetical protein
VKPQLTLTRGRPTTGGGRKGNKPELNVHHQDMIEKMLWLPETSNYVTAGRDGMLWVWKDQGLTPQRSIRNGPGWITDVAQVRGSAGEGAGSWELAEGVVVGRGTASVKECLSGPN